MGKMNCKASLRYRNPSGWDQKTRSDIALWMRNKADELENDHSYVMNMADGITLRYHPDDADAIQEDSPR